MPPSVSPVGIAPPQDKEYGFWGKVIHAPPTKDEAIGQGVSIALSVGFGGYEVYKMMQPKKRSTGQKIWSAVQIALSVITAAFGAYRLHKYYNPEKPPPYSVNDPHPPTYNRDTPSRY